MDKTDQYSFEIQWSPQDDVYVAFCQEFPGLSAFGDTRAEAVEEGEKALELFIEDYRKMADELPEPNILEY